MIYIERQTNIYGNVCPHVFTIVSPPGWMPRTSFMAHLFISAVEVTPSHVRLIVNVRELQVEDQTLQMSHDLTAASKRLNVNRHFRQICFANFTDSQHPCLPLCISVFKCVCVSVCKLPFA